MQNKEVKKLTQDEFARLVFDMPVGEKYSFYEHVDHDTLLPEEWHCVTKGKFADMLYILAAYGGGGGASLFVNIEWDANEEHFKKRFLGYLDYCNMSEGVYVTPDMKPYF